MQTGLVYLEAKSEGLCDRMPGGGGVGQREGTRTTLGILGE